MVHYKALWYTGSISTIVQCGVSKDSDVFLKKISAAQKAVKTEAFVLTFEYLTIVLLYIFFIALFLSF